MYGKQIRLSRIIKPSSNRGIIIPYAHGILSGPLPGLETAKEYASFLKLFEESDITGVIINPGILKYFKNIFIGENSPSLIVLIDWCSLIYDDQVDFKRKEGISGIFCAVEKAMKVGADALMIYLILGHSDPLLDLAEIKKCGLIIDECDRFGLPVMIEPCMANIKDKETFYDTNNIRKNNRIACELGADIIKSHYTGDKESFKSVVSSCFTPILVAGGDNSNNSEENFRTIKEMMESGANGLVMGRKIFQSKDPVYELSKICEIVYTQM